MAEPGDDAAAVVFIREAPFEAVQALLGCLSPKSIRCMRALCTAWPNRLRNRTRLSDYRIESLDLRSGELRTALRFTDNENYFRDAHDLEGGYDAPPIEDHFVVNYAGMENYGEAIAKPQVTVHASLDGYLLVSSPALRRWYIINPATRNWVSLFDPTTFGLDVIGFYEYGRYGKYHLLCLRRSNAIDRHDEATTYTYHVVAVRPGERRHIGCPISPTARKDHGLRFGVERASVSPPIQWKRGNMDLVWPPQESQGYHMLVFNTRTEKFSWKRSPPPVTMNGDQHMRLLGFPNGDLGLSVSRENQAMLELWRLQDYQNGVWVLNHRIQLALQQMPALLHLHGDPWVPAVVSAEGDVLIESQDGLFHCDRGGNLLRRFWFSHQTQNSHRMLPITHVLRRSFVQHPMFGPSTSQNAVEPPFFRWLGSDE